jgi:S1-C subfamily serine protease
MGSPRHLWSGDWQLDSAAAAEELAKRRAQSPEPEEPAPPAPSRPSLRERIVAALRRARRNLADLISRARAAWARGRRGRRFALGALLVVLIGAGLVFAAVSLIESGGNGSQTASLGRGWIGITHLENAPSGVVITGIAPGSPAASAGLEPGDVITGIGNQQVHTVADVNAALNGLVPGNTVQIQFGRGPSSFSTLATLTTHPHGGP